MTTLETPHAPNRSSALQEMGEIELLLEAAEASLSKGATDASTGYGRRLLRSSSSAIFLGLLISAHPHPTHAPMFADTWSLPTKRCCTWAKSQIYRSRTMACLTTTPFSRLATRSRE
jgi:hypothetical protein